MKPEEWRELKNFKGPESDKRYKQLLRMTNKVDEHPEEYNGPCLCRLCCSYGD